VTVSRLLFGYDFGIHAELIGKLCALVSILNAAQIGALFRREYRIVAKQQTRHGHL